MEEVKKVINPEEVTNELDAEQTLAVCQSVGITFEDVKKLGQMNQEFSELEKKIKPLKDKIKNALLDAKAKKGTFGDLELTVTFQNRDTMDEDKLVAILKEKGLTDALITIEKPDPNKLPGLIGDGLITDADIAKCMIPNKIAILKFPSKRGSKAQKQDAENIMNNVNKSTTTSSGKKGMF
jgi:hypothetical protein